MECNEKNQIAKIKHVAGNVLKLAVRLTLRTIESVNGEIQHTDTDFIPSSDYPVVIQFKKKSFKLNFDATMHGSVAYIEDMGTIPVGTYDFSVLCKDDIGRPYKFKQRATLQVYEYTADAGIDKDIEFEAKIWYLDSAIFLALKGEGGYEIPDGGIPMSDLSEEVRVLLSKAETALQEHQSLVGFYTKDEIRNLLSGKVDKVEGKGLSANDYTTAEKQKLANIAENATANNGTVTGLNLFGKSKSPNSNGIVDLNSLDEIGLIYGYIMSSGNIMIYTEFSKVAIKSNAILILKNNTNTKFTTDFQKKFNGDPNNKLYKFILFGIEFGVNDVAIFYYNGVGFCLISSKSLVERFASADIENLKTMANSAIQTITINNRLLGKKNNNVFAVDPSIITPYYIDDISLEYDYEFAPQGYYDQYNGKIIAINTGNVISILNVSNDVTSIPLDHVAYLNKADGKFYDLSKGGNLDDMLVFDPSQVIGGKTLKRLPQDGKVVVHKCIPMRPALGTKYYFENEVQVIIRPRDFKDVAPKNVTWPWNGYENLEEYNNDKRATHKEYEFNFVSPLFDGINCYQGNYFGEDDINGNTFVFDFYSPSSWKCNAIFRFKKANCLITITEDLIDEDGYLKIDELSNKLFFGGKNIEIGSMITCDTASPNFRIDNGHVSCVARINEDYLKKLIGYTADITQRTIRCQVDGIHKTQDGKHYVDLEILDNYGYYISMGDFAVLTGDGLLPSVLVDSYNSLFDGDFITCSISRNSYLALQKGAAISHCTIVSGFKRVPKKLAFFYKRNYGMRHKDYCRLRVENGSFPRRIMDVRKKVRGKYISSIPFPVLFADKVNYIVNKIFPKYRT